MRATTSGVRFARFFGTAAIFVVLTQPEATLAASFVKVSGADQRRQLVDHGQRPLERRGSRR